MSEVPKHGVLEGSRTTNAAPETIGSSQSEFEIKDELKFKISEKIFRQKSDQVIFSDALHLYDGPRAIPLRENGFPK
jgi:hypothetical protein